MSSNKILDIIFLILWMIIGVLTIIPAIIERNSVLFIASYVCCWAALLGELISDIKRNI